MGKADRQPQKTSLLKRLDKIGLARARAHARTRTLRKYVFSQRWDRWVKHGNFKCYCWSEPCCRCPTFGKGWGQKTVCAGQRRVLCPTFEDVKGGTEAFSSLFGVRLAGRRYLIHYSWGVNPLKTAKSGRIYRKSGWNPSLLDEKWMRRTV